MDVRFIEEPYKGVIKDGFVIMSWPNGERRSVPLRVFRKDQEHATRLLADYDAKSADIIPFGRKRRT